MGNILGRDTMKATRVAVLGLYRSGSSAVAGVLHHIGVDMGAPFYRDHYESRKLAARLRRWWSEPYGTEAYPRSERVRKLGDWVAFLEMGGATHVGAKHPLLSLCGDDLVEAWGPEVKFIWTDRPLAESIASIKREAWWGGNEPAMEHIQRQLWDEVHRFFSRQEHLRIEFADTLADPERQIRRIAEYVGIQPDEARIAAALAWVRPERSAGGAAGR